MNDYMKKPHEGTADSIDNPATPLAAHKKILLLSVSAGAGHTRAAEAIQAYADTQGVRVSATHLDVMDFVPAGFRKLYTDVYLGLVARYPGVWRYLYRLTDRVGSDGTLQKLRRAIERMNTRRLTRAIAAASPDAIVCTHFLPAEILSRLVQLQRLSCPVWVQVTDFDVHGMWVHEHIDGYFAASEQVAFRLRAQGIAPDRIHVTGIPIMPAFHQALCRSECAAQFGLDPRRRTVLLMGGGHGIGRLDMVAAQLLALPADYQLVVLAGKNAAALAALHSLGARHPRRLFAFGFTDQVARLMACADLVVTKPGGLTSSECLAMGLPMIVNDPIPGQEERNADFLMEQGVAFKTLDSASLAYRIQYLLDRPAKLADMRRQAQQLARPIAARHVLETVLKHEWITSAPVPATPLLSDSCC